MAQTLISRETFESAGTLQTGTIGGFSAIPTGSMLKHRRGYWVTGTGASPGRSGVVKDVDLEAYFTQSISGGNIYSIHCAVRFRNFGVAGPTTSATFMRALKQDFSELITVGVQADGHMAVFDAGVGLTQLTEVLTLNTDYYFTFTVQQNANTSTTYQVHRKGIGGVLTQIYDKGAAAFLGATSIERLQVCNKFFGVVAHWRGHLGVVGLYSEGSFADVAFPADVNEPPQTALTWWTSATGQIAGDGSQGDPWAQSNGQITFFNDEFAYGLFENNAGFASGDTVYFDTSNGNDLDLRITGAPHSLIIGCGGVNVLPIPGQTYWKVRAWETVNFWVQDGTNANLWRYTPSGGNSGDGICIWENDVNPSKIKLSSYASEAAALADMNTKPVGEFWWYPEVSGNSVVIKPSGNGNPTTNGKTYTAAGNISAIGLPPVIVTAPNVNVDGVHVIKTCLAKSSATAGIDGDPIDGVGLNFDVGSGGNYRLANAFFDKCSKHGYKISHGSSNSTLTETNVSLGTCSNYCNFGGQTGVAYFNGNDAATGNVVNSTNLSQPLNAMLPQSIGGVVNSSYPSVLVHHNTSGSQFTTITLSNANLASTVSKQIGVEMIINASKIGAIGNAAGTMTVNSQSRISGGISGLGITINPGCAIVVAEILSAANTTIQISGAISIIGCTIDASACSAGDSTASIFYRTAAAAITLGSNAWKFGGKDIAVVANAATGEITANDNWYEKPIGNRLYENYNASDRTGTQWQALGFDANGGFAADLKTDANLRPYFNSSLLNVASIARWPTLASSRDWFGRARPASGNTDAGAAVYATPATTRLTNSVDIGI